MFASRASKKIIFEVTPRKVSTTHTIFFLDLQVKYQSGPDPRDCGICCLTGLEKDNFRGHTLKSVTVHFQILIISWMQLIRWDYVDSSSMFHVWTDTQTGTQGSQRRVYTRHPPGAVVLWSPYTSYYITLCVCVCVCVCRHTHTHTHTHNLCTKIHTHIRAVSTYIERDTDYKTHRECQPII